MSQLIPVSDNNVIDSLKGTDSSCESSFVNRYKQVGRAVCFTLTLHRCGTAKVKQK